jgi:hypothetical protein
MTDSLDDAQPSELLKKMSGSDTVERKLTFPDSGFRSVVDYLQMEAGNRHRR